MMRLSEVSKGSMRSPGASIFSMRSTKKGSKSSKSSKSSLRKKSTGSMGSKTSGKIIPAKKSLVSLQSILSAHQELDYLKGKYRLKALVRKVLINLSWLLETPTEEGEEDEGSKWARAMLRAKSRRRREGTQIFTWEEKVLFHKPPENRTLDDTEKAYQVVKRMNLFKNYREDIQKGLAATLYFMYVPQNRTVLRQGHDPHALYFILQGDVLISIMKEDPYSNEMVSENVAILTRGDMFGEVALLRNITRTATVFTATACELLALNRDDFVMVLKSSLSAQWERFRTELMRFSYFDGLSDVHLREACILGRMRKFQREETILGDGSGTHEYAYFLLSGTCTVVQTLTVEAWEEFGDTIYRLLDDPTLVAVRKLPEECPGGKARLPSVAIQELAAQDEWSLVAQRLEHAIGSEPTSLVWKRARSEVERVLEKEEPFKRKTVVHTEEWDQARQRVLETLGAHTTRGASISGPGSAPGSVVKAEGSNESLARMLRRRSTLGGGSATLMGNTNLSPQSPLSPNTACIPSGPEAVHASILVERPHPAEQRHGSGSGLEFRSGSPDARSSIVSERDRIGSDRSQPFLDAARASVLGRSASISRPSNVSRFSTVKVTDGRPSVVPMPGFGPYGPALLRLAERAGAIGVGLRGLANKRPDGPRPKVHRIEMVRGQREKKHSSKPALLRLDHMLQHFPFRMQPPNTDKGQQYERMSSGEMHPQQHGRRHDPADTRGRAPGSGDMVKAFISDIARKHTLKRKYAYEDPFKRTPKPRRISLASRSSIRTAWMNAVNVLRDCLDRCEETAGDPKRIDIMVEFWRKARLPIERLMKKEHTPVLEPHHHIDCHFVQVCFYTPLAVFGIGESLDQRRVIANSPVECLLLPRYWLETINQGNVWDRVRLYLNRAIPDSKAVFRCWAEERRWLRYRSHLVAEQIDKRYVDSGTTPYDVPYSLRLGEVKDPHA